VLFGENFTVGSWYINRKDADIFYVEFVVVACDWRKKASSLEPVEHASPCYCVKKGRTT
jgi:hypothetical protein